MSRSLNFEIRRARLSDVDAIAAAHADSILSLGPRYYEPSIVRAWSAGLEGRLYAQAMARGEAFFIAVDRLGESSEVLGFSSHRVDDSVHGTAVYVRGTAARGGVGSALFHAAEADARTAGARTIEIDASLAAVDFYTAHGFVEIGRGAHVLPSGVSMACVVMRKELGMWAGEVAPKLARFTRERRRIGRWAGRQVEAGRQVGLTLNPASTREEPRRLDRP